MGNWGRPQKCLFILIICLLLVALFPGNTAVIAQTGPTTYYVDATGGNDANDGTSPSTAWHSIFKVNNSEFNPGDSILFKRGEVWRELLMVPSSGDSNNYITFGAYGTGDKPLLLGSVARSSPDDWIDEGNNVWSTVDSKDGFELLKNPGFDDNLDNWVFWAGNGADASISLDTEIYDSAPACARIDCVTNNQETGSIFLYSGEYSITANEWYLVSYHAKGSSSFSIHLPPNLSKADWGEEHWSLRSRRYNVPISPEWATYNFYYLASTTASDVQVFLDLGTIPDGESLYIDTLSFQKCDKAPVAADVGSMIFNSEELVGVKVHSPENLDTQGEFWFDPITSRLKLYSVGNPADHYSDIECALGIFAGRSAYTAPVMCIYEDYVTVENLDLRYSGADAIWVEDVAGVVIRNCDISFCGGTRQSTDLENTVRMGNGITFWENTRDCIVESCRIGNIYDAGISNQGETTNIQDNIYYRNNLIWNAEYSFEIWDKPATSSMSNIYVECNVCIGAGFGWSHKQRPDPHGWHLALWGGSNASTDNIYIHDNVFYEAAFSALYYDGSDREWTGLMIDYNHYYQKTGEMFAFKFDTKYTMEQFAEYQRDKGFDLHSVTGDGEVVKEAARAITRTEDIVLLDELFDITDTLEPTKNAGVTLEGATYAFESPEPMITETTAPVPAPAEPTATPPEEPYTPPTTEPQPSANGQDGPPASAIILIVVIILVLGAGVIGVIMYIRRKKGDSR